MEPVIFKQVPTRIPRKKIHRLFSLVSRGERVSARVARINVIFTTDEFIRVLNRQFRGKDRATDVLSFELAGPGDDGEETFGEIYISLPTAQRQAQEYGTTFNEEVLRLVCHGLLHLLGYDHEKEEDARMMRQREERYLSALRGK